MTTKYYRTEIQATLVAAAVTGPFYAITYNPTTHLPVVGSAVTPAQALANETSGEFAVSSTNRRAYVRERSKWTFELMVAFNQEVLLEAFEGALCATPLTIAKDKTNGLPRTVLLDLVGSKPVHPPQQQPSSGTQVIYTFEARLSPV